MLAKANQQHSSTRRLILGAAALAVSGVALGGLAMTAHSQPPPAPDLGAVDQAPAAGGTVLVFVSGAVVHPGLYRLSTATRVADAIAAAGGLTPYADSGRLPNFSALVHDGHQINVPLGHGPSAAAKLDINSATADELADLPGMPAGLPDEIVQFRDQWGGFTTLSQLHDDLGVDSETVAGLRSYLRVDPPPP